MGGDGVVCLVSELRLPHFASVEIQLFSGYEPKIGDKVIPQSTHQSLLDRVEALERAYTITAINAKESARRDSDAHDLIRAAAGEMQNIMARQIADELRCLVADAKNGELT